MVSFPEALTGVGGLVFDPQKCPKTSQKIFLKNLKISLDVIHEKTPKIFKKLIEDKFFNRVYWNKSCHINENKVEEDIKKILNNNNIFFKEFDANLLNPIQKIKKDDGTPFKVFTHYWKKAEQIYLRDNYEDNYKHNYIH